MTFLKAPSRYLCLVVFVTSLSGCILAPFIDSFNKIGLTKGDRMALLPQQIKRFNEGLYWGRVQESYALIEDSKRPEVSRQIHDSLKNQKMVDAKVDFVNYSPRAFDADVDVIVRYYAIPSYVVKERVETQKWSFSFAGGWRLVDLAEKQPVS